MSQPSNGSSGKLLIVVILLVALAAAAGSWWFRYAATHRTAEFWGPTAAALIRDAPRVTLRTFDAAAGVDAKDADPLPRDISHAPGLTHLRTALIEDRSYDWEAKPPADSNFKSSLVFENTAGAEPRLVILFSPDFNYAANGSSNTEPRPIVSCRPIAAGLQTFFAEQQAAPAER